MERQIERRKKTIERLEKEGVSHINLPHVENSTEVKLKSLDDICKRLCASIISISLAFELMNGTDSKDFFEKELERFDVKNELNATEKNYLVMAMANKTWLMLRGNMNVTGHYAGLWALLMMKNFAHQLPFVMVLRLFLLLIQLNQLMNSRVNVNLKT